MVLAECRVPSLMSRKSCRVPIKGALRADFPCTVCRRESAGVQGEYCPSCKAPLEKPATHSSADCGVAAGDARRRLKKGCEGAVSGVG